MLNTLKKLVTSKEKYNPLEDEKFVIVKPKENLEELMINFEPQAAIEKLKSFNYQKNNYSQEKSLYIKKLSELVEIIGDDLVAILKDLLQKMLNDDDNLILLLLSQIEGIVNYFNSVQTICTLLFPRDKEKMVYPFLKELLFKTENLEVKVMTGHNLGKLVPILNEKDRGDYILTMVLKLAHDNEDETSRLVACKLLQELAPKFGKDLCEQFIGFEILSLGQDPQLRVRKEAVNSLSIIIPIVSEKFYLEKLLPFYCERCAENTWSVRKACVDIISQISNISNQKIREDILTKRMLKFLTDRSRWVKIQGYKKLGEFIITLEGSKVDDKLIKHFAAMADNKIANLATEKEVQLLLSIPIACAQYFPAVLQVCGPKKWPLLKKLYDKLLKLTPRVTSSAAIQSLQIRYPLACSVHEVARIIGPKLSKQNLFPVIDKLLHDKNSKVKRGAIKNMSSFYKSLDPEIREQLVDVFLEVQVFLLPSFSAQQINNKFNWRIREVIAGQMDTLVTTFTPDTTFRVIMPICFQMTRDDVSIVRKKAAKGVYNLFWQMYNSGNDMYKLCVIENIKAYAVLPKYSLRQVFLFIAGPLIKHFEIFEEHFLDLLVEFVNEKVPNVRIMLARIVSENSKVKHDKSNQKQVNQFLSNKKVQQMILKLSTDKENDVSSLMKPILEYIAAEQLQQDITKEQSNDMVTEETPQKDIDEIKENKNKQVDDIESSGTQEEEKEEIPQVQQVKDKDQEEDNQGDVKQEKEVKQEDKHVQNVQKVELVQKEETVEKQAREEEAKEEVIPTKPKEEVSNQQSNQEEPQEQKVEKVSKDQEKEAKQEDDHHDDEKEESEEKVQKTEDKVEKVEKVEEVIEKDKAEA